MSNPHDPYEYTPTEPYQQLGSAVPPNATREMPRYDGSWGAAAPYDEYQAGGAYPGPSTGPVGATGLPVPPRRRRRWWIAVAGVAVVVAVLGGVGVGAWLAGRHSSAPIPYTEPLTTSVEPPAVPGLGVPGLGVPGLGVPGIGPLSGVGATVGTVSANDGTTLTIQSVMGESVTVHTDSRTQVVATNATDVASLHVGDSVVVQGDRSPDGSIQAKFIVGTAIPTR